METGPRLKVSSDRLVKPRIELATPGLQSKRFIRYTTVAPQGLQVNDFKLHIKIQFCKRYLRKWRNEYKKISIYLECLYFVQNLLHQMGTVATKPVFGGLGHNARKPVFGVSDKASFKQVFSATETG